MLVSFSVQESAVYRVKVYLSEDNILTNVWNQDIFIEKDTYLNNSTINSLAQKYAPIVMFHKDEEFFPVSFEDIFNASVTNNVVVKETLFGGSEMPYSLLEEFISYNGHKDYVIKGDLDLGLKEVTGSLENSKAYYSYFERENDIYINYHFIYAFDPKTGTKNNPSWNAHNFDRESVTIVLDKNSMEPKDFIYSAHLPSQLIKLVGSSNEMSEGRLKIDYNNIIKYGEHPIISAARGAHALYPVSGDYDVMQWGVDTWITKLTEPAGLTEKLYVNDFETLPSLSQYGSKILLPGASEFNNVENFNSYELSRLDFSQTSSSEGSYITFSGKWVEIAKDFGDLEVPLSPVEFPPFTAKEKLIESYVSNADITWDLNDIPQSSSDSVRDSKLYLARHIIKAPENLNVSSDENMAEITWSKLYAADAYRINKIITYTSGATDSISELYYTNEYNDTITYSEILPQDISQISYSVSSLYFVEKGVINIEIIDMQNPEIGNTYASLPCNEVTLVIETGNTGMGWISGNVKEIVSRNWITGVTVTVTDSDNNVLATSVTGEYADFNISLPEGSGYKVTVSNGSLPLVYENITVEAEETKYLDTIELIPESYQNNVQGYFHLRIGNDEPREVISNATVRLRENYNNFSGDIVRTEALNNYYFTFNNLANGYYTVEISAPGYITQYYNFTAANGINTVRYFFLTAPVPEDQIRIVVDHPPLGYSLDFDSHMTGPKADATRFHIYEDNRSYSENSNLISDFYIRGSVPFPQVINLYLNNLNQGEYRYSIHNYSAKNYNNDWSLAQIKLKIRVYKGSSLVDEFSSHLKPGNFWKVFKYVDGKIIGVNEFTDCSDETQILLLN